jgi:CheY-like chemotaxis protein
MSERVRFLLVDDDQLDILTVRRVFSRAHLNNELHVARDATEALRYLESGSVPLSRLVILLDVNMPRINGHELLATLKRHDAFKKIPVVMLSTSSDANDRRRAFEGSAAGYLAKPADFEHFVKMMSLVESYWSLNQFPG